MKTIIAFMAFNISFFAMDGILCLVTPENVGLLVIKVSSWKRVKIFLDVVLIFHCICSQMY